MQGVALPIDALLWCNRSRGTTDTSGPTAICVHLCSSVFPRSGALSAVRSDRRCSGEHATRLLVLRSKRNRRCTQIFGLVARSDHAYRPAEPDHGGARQNRSVVRAVGIIQARTLTWRSPATPMPWPGVAAVRRQCGHLFGDMVDSLCRAGWPGQAGACRTANLSSICHHNDSPHHQGRTWP
jgi:hypothetical protein